MILEDGVAKCIFEPRGDNGLEGYQLNDEYKYQLMVQNLPSGPAKYYRIYLSDDYYETCGRYVFGCYFKRSEGSNG